MSEVWIGLVHLLPRDERARQEILKGAPGAYANALTVARDRRDYLRRVRNAADELGFVVHDVEDVERFIERARRGDTQHLRSLVDEAARGEVAWATFHAYDESDEGKSSALS